MSLARLVVTASVHSAHIGISKLSINWLKEGKLRPISHLHGIFTRAIHMFLVLYTNLATIIIALKSRWHSYHHFRRLWARIHRGVLCGWIFVSLFVLSCHLARLTNSNLLSLPCDLDIRIHLTPNHNIFFHKLNRIILTVWSAVLIVSCGWSTELTWV